jgi:hypothetical protein
LSPLEEYYMASDSNAKWSNSKETITGSWYYNWAADKFHICIRKQPKDKKYQFRNLDFDCYGDEPEFGHWKLER